MAEQQTDRYALPLLQAGQAQKELKHNEALVRLDMLTMAAANGVANEPPVTPVAGDCWIVGQAPTGEWAGHAGALAGWTESGWRMVPPRPGMRVWLIPDGHEVRRHGDTWIRGEVTGLHIAGQQIVGPRQPAIAAPSGGEFQDVSARSAIQAMLLAMRGHGLIAD